MARTPFQKRCDDAWRAHYDVSLNISNSADWAEEWALTNPVQLQLGDLLLPSRGDG